MAKVDVEELKAELNLTPFGAQGWLQNKNEPCAFCGRGGKWGLLLNQMENVMVYHCWYCNTKTSLFNYLKKINRLDLWHSRFQNTAQKDSLPMFKDDDEEEEETELPDAELPKRLEPIPVDSDPYLKGRGFTEHHYRLFEPSVTNFILERKLRDYIIFKIKMDDRVVAWLARSRKSKEFHIQNLKDVKQGKARLQLRYENSKTNFRKIVGAYDNITDNTQCVIIVEGLFDYINVDNRLHLQDSEAVRCCFTFGNSISREQVELLKRKPGLKEVVIMYDPDVTENIASAAITVSRSFETWIALLKNKRIDPGDATRQELDDALDNLVTPFDFFSGLV